MNFLLDPNVAYFLLVFGFLFAVLSLFTPGTGILEIGAIFALLLAGYSMLTLPINIWALGILILGVFPFLIALKRSHQYWYLVLSIAALVIGTVFLFRTTEGKAAIDPLLAVIISSVVILILWVIGRRGIEASLQQPVHDLDRLLGKTGLAGTDIHHEGSLQIGGEEWTAQSKTLIPAGTEVRVVSRSGLVLQVEPVSSDN